jgi:CBS domain-containing protein
MDVSKRDAKVCVRVAGRGRGKTAETVRTWASTTNAILRLREHLIEERVSLVVMEATGDYWKPFYYLLEDAGFEVMLVKARQVKNLPGRKSDVSDATWLAQLGAHGLVRGAIQPSPADGDHRTSARSPERAGGYCEQHPTIHQERHMATARDIMTSNAECVSVNDTLTDAARKLRDLDVGAMPICGEDNRLKGMLTDRDIVVKCIAEGGDPASTKVSELAEGKPVTIGADDSVEETLRTMKEHGVRRLPVIDGHDLIGIVSQADGARNLPEDKIGDLVEAISSAPSNSD